MLALIFLNTVRQQWVDKQKTGGGVMAEENKYDVLGELRDALETVPEEYHAEVAKSLIHDIHVVARTIAMVSLKEPKPAA